MNKKKEESKDSLEEDDLKELANTSNSLSYNFLFLFLLLFCMYNYFWVIFKVLDGAVGGNWRAVPPFSLLKHPHPDFHLSLEELVRQEPGLNVERHSIETVDGYINTCFRVLREGEFPG